MFPFFDDLDMDNESIETAADPVSRPIYLGIIVCMAIAAAGALWATSMVFSL
ncbi:MAG: hypothetical protein LBE84_01305 [Planctomycetota bacterium]|jgi:hypothetical protein|nr:hypothetical protein [Planctomycetota bacterium]